MKAGTPGSKCFNVHVAVRPGVLVSVNNIPEGETKPSLRAAIDAVAPVAHLDYRNGAPTATVRFESAERAAAAVSAFPKVDGTAAIFLEELSLLETQQYWSRVSLQQDRKVGRRVARPGLKDRGNNLVSSVEPTDVEISVAGSGVDGPPKKRRKRAVKSVHKHFEDDVNVGGSDGASASAGGDSKLSEVTVSGQ